MLYAVGKLLSSAVQYTCKLCEIRGTRTCIRVHVMGVLAIKVNQMEVSENFSVLVMVSDDHDHHE